MIQLDYLMLADAAAAPPDGKLYIHGAGWDTIAAPAYPVTHLHCAVALLVRVPWNEANRPFRLEVDVIDADGATILPTPPGPMGGMMNVGRPPSVPAGNDLIQPLVFNVVGLTFPRAGDYVLVARIDGAEVKRFPLHLIQATGPGTPPGAAPA